MKKNYLKPETFELAVVIDNIMLQDSNPSIENNESDDQDRFGAGKNRGEWGNVWK